MKPGDRTDFLVGYDDCGIPVMAVSSALPVAPLVGGDAGRGIDPFDKAMFK